MFTYPLSDSVVETLKPQIIAALKAIYDPDFPVNIYDLGFIRNLEMDRSGVVYIEMTLTTMGCPHSEFLVNSVEQNVTQVPGIIKTYVDLVWDPPWRVDQLPEAIRLDLGLL